MTGHQTWSISSVSRIWAPDETDRLLQIVKGASMRHDRVPWETVNCQGASMRHDRVQWETVRKVLKKGFPKRTLIACQKQYRIMKS